MRVLHLVKPYHLYAAVRLLPTFMDRPSGKSLQGGAWATGFVIGPPDGNGHRGFIVTNRHVVDPGFQDPPRYGLELVSVAVHGHQQRAGGGPPSTEASTHVGVRVLSSTDENRDIALIDRSSGQVNVDAGTASVNWYPYDALALDSDFEDGLITVGDYVCVAGYPGGLRSGRPTERPILASGFIASDPRFDAEYVGGSGAGEILCHALSWGGMSGGPVVGWPLGKEGRMTVVGINAGHLQVGGEAAGVLNRVVKASAILQILRDHGEPVD